MIQTHIRFHFSIHDFEFLRKSAELHLPHVRDNHRLEILSRAAGFASLEVLKSSREIQNGREISLSTNLKFAVQYANQIGYKFEAKLFYDILSTAIMPKVASSHPLLHENGYGKSILYPTDREFDKIRQSFESDNHLNEINALIESRLNDQRKRLFDIVPRPHLLHALALISCAEPTKSTNTKRSSTSLKNLAENIKFCLPLDVQLHAGPVTETDLIAAALYYGFKPTVEGKSRYYVRSRHAPTFNISEKSIKPLARESTKNGPQSRD